MAFWLRRIVTTKKTLNYFLFRNQKWNPDVLNYSMKSSKNNSIVRIFQFNQGFSINTKIRTMNHPENPPPAALPLTAAPSAVKPAPAKRTKYRHVYCVKLRRWLVRFVLSFQSFLLTAIFLLPPPLQWNSHTLSNIWENASALPFGQLQHMERIPCYLSLRWRPYQLEGVECHPNWRHC